MLNRVAEGTEDAADFSGVVQAADTAQKKIGHCSFLRQYPNNPSLDQWCKSLITAYRLIHQGKKSEIKMSQDRIQRADDNEYGRFLQFQK